MNWNNEKLRLVCYLKVLESCSPTLPLLCLLLKVMSSVPDGHPYFCALVFFVFPCENKQKLSGAWSFMDCNLPFWRTYWEELQALRKGCLLLLVSPIYRYAQDLKTIKGHLDLANLHFWVWAWPVKSILFLDDFQESS